MKLIDPSIFDNLLDAVLITDADYKFMYANTQFCILTDLVERRLRGKDLSEIFPLKEWIKKPSINQGVLIRKSETQQGPVQVCAENIQFQEQKAMFFYVRDISVEGELQAKYRAELKEKEGVISRLDRKLFEVSFLLEMSSILNLRSSGDDIFHLAVELILTQFQVQRVALMSQESEVPKILASAGPSVERGFWQEALVSSPPDIFKIEMQSTNGTAGCLLVESKTAPAKEDQNLLSSATSQLMARVEQEILYFSSITDEKTKLFNSRYLQSSLDREIKRSERWGESFGLLIVDIDHFKKFNDSYGHQVGDEVLVHVAQLIKSVTRSTDVVARFGGEEFCVVAAKADIPGIKILMERIRKKVETKPLVSLQHGVLKVTVSIGGSIFPTQTSSKDDLFSKADQALYASKGNGRNQFTLWSEALKNS